MMIADRPFDFLEPVKGILPAALIITAVLSSVCFAGEWNFVMDPNNPMLTAVPGTWQSLFDGVYMVKAGEQYFLYYSAETSEYYGRIGLATSSDGSHFSPQESWVLDKGVLDFEKRLATAPRALWFPGYGMRLWYWGFSGAHPYAQGMGEARSPDGINFTRYPLNPQWDASSIADWIWGSASVLYDPDDPDSNRMFKQYVSIWTGGLGRIALMTSHDGMEWTWCGYVLEEGPPGSWDDSILIYPFVKKYGEGYFMLYGCGVESGVAVSQDGLLWVKRPDNPNPDIPRTWNTTGWIEGDVLHLWYTSEWKGDEILHTWSEIPEDLYDVSFPTPVPSSTPTSTPTQSPTPVLTSTPTPTFTATPTPNPTQKAFAVRVCVSFAGKCRAGNRVLIKACVDPKSAWPEIDRVDFQCRPSGTGLWFPIPAANVNHPNPDFTHPFFIHWDVSVLPNGYYDIRAIATDVTGWVDPSPEFVTFLVHSTCGRWARLNQEGETQAVAPVSKSEDSEVVGADSERPNTAEVILPAGALVGDTTMVMTFRDPGEFATTLGPLSGVDHFVDLRLESGQSSLLGGAKAWLSFGYSDADNDGLVDGFDISEELLGLYWYDGSDWQAVGDSQVDPVLNEVRGSISHFTPFGVLALPPPLVEEWKSY